MDVRLPDGTVIRGVPDGTTKAQLREKLARNGYDVSGLGQETTVAQDIKQGVGNLVAGAARGAGSIGATILSPIDAAARALNDGKPINIGGFDIAGHDRRAGMDAGLTSMGADTNSLMFKGGKIGAEIAGTMGAGGAIANTVGRVAPAVATAAPNVMNAIRTAGMTGGNAITRAAGGAITGGASAGLVDPNEALTGAAIGGAAPGVIQLAGKGGKALANAFSGPKAAPDLIAATQKAQAAGYVIPPTQVKPSMTNRLMEGMSGKITTAQNASAKNQVVTNDLAATAIGLQKGTTLTPATLDAVRDQAGQAYRSIGATGVVKPGAAYDAALDKIAQPFKLTQGAFPNAKASPVLDLVDSLRSPAFASASAVEKIKQLRTAADDAFRTGNTDVGRAARAGANALEDAIEDHLQIIGQPQLLDQFREARKLIAKTYSVQRALNPVTGTVDAKNLAVQLKKGKPLSGELLDAAEFAARFPKAAQPMESMGSLPQMSPLDWALGVGTSVSSRNPLMMASVLARPAVRSAILSGPVQRGLTNQKPNAIAALLSNQKAQQAIYRGAPVIGASE